MRVTDLEIRNFRAIEHFSVENLDGFVVIAGANGCGKTTVLDALRLLKSVHVKDEWKRWFGEFAINAERGTDVGSMLRDPSKEATVRAKFLLSPEERQFLSEAADNIMLALVLRDSTSPNCPVNGRPPVVPPDITAKRSKKIRSIAQKGADRLRDDLARLESFEASLTIGPDRQIYVGEAGLPSVVFSCFQPDALGELEFHASRRLYQRETVANVRLRVTDRTAERQSRFLYDYENKYKNIKTQLGEEFVVATLKGQDPNEAPLQRSIRELFRIFFPGKNFEGVELADDGSLRFPVTLDTGERHDIDDLSSGEKEIVYGYLWLRTGTPARSVILVDEPELHLNPALVQGLPSFYKKNLADALSAQVWIVTHSDAILRQAVRDPGMAVFHMGRAVNDGENQAHQIDTQDKVEAAVIDLVGDLAAYRPHAKIVLVEGRRETRFDVDMIRRLFPELAERANFIPGGNRRTTSGVTARLLEVLEESGFAGRAVSITDRDLGLIPRAEADGSILEWPVYEIENFLLDPSVVRGACQVLLREDPYSTDEEVVADLRVLAERMLDRLAAVEVQAALNDEFIRSVDIGSGGDDPLGGLVASSVGTKQRLSQIDISAARIQALFEQAKDTLAASLASDEFLTRFPGDRLLRALGGKHSVAGEPWRNACLDQAQRLGFRPEGMLLTLTQALEL